MRLLIRDETSNAESLSSTDAASTNIGNGTGNIGAKITVGGITVVVNVGIIGSQRVQPSSVKCSTGTVAAPTCNTGTPVNVSLGATPVMWNWECGGVASKPQFQGPTLGCVTIMAGPEISASVSGSTITFTGQNTSDTSGHNCGSCSSTDSFSIRYTFV